MAGEKNINRFALLKSERLPRTLLFLLVLTGLTIFLFGLRQTVSTQPQEPLTLAEVLTALQSKSANLTLAQKNKFITQRVKERGVTFQLTPEIEKELKRAGASSELIEAIRQNSPTPGPSPLITATATPPPTPSPKTPTPTPTPLTVKPKQIKNPIGMEFILIPKGTFLMGSVETEKDRHKSESPQHRVNINYEFYLGKYEVTQSQWDAVIGGLPEGMQSNLDKRFMENPNQPVVRISWVDAKTFIDKLNARNDGFRYRLPSEAEWEYAARGGTQTRFYWGDDPSFSTLCKYANVKDYSDCPDRYFRTAPVGSYLPNAFGLYDMTGNIWEWCEDIYQDSYDNLPTDGSANLRFGDSSKRVQRGGSWADNPKNARLAIRGYDVPTDRNDEDGFRVVVDVR